MELKKLIIEKTERSEFIEHMGQNVLENDLIGFEDAEQKGIELANLANNVVLTGQELFILI